MSPIQIQPIKCGDILSADVIIPKVHFKMESVVDIRYAFHTYQFCIGRFGGFQSECLPNLYNRAVKARHIKRKV